MKPLPSIPVLGSASSNRAQRDAFAAVTASIASKRCRYPAEARDFLAAFAQRDGLRNDPQNKPSENPNLENFIH